jgi:hypothetical protein
MQGLSAPPISGEQRIISQPSQPIAMPPEKGLADWGLTIGIVGWLGKQLWELFNRQQSAEAKLTQDLVTATLKQNEILLTAFVERKS